MNGRPHHLLVAGLATIIQCQCRIAGSVSAVLVGVACMSTSASFKGLFALSSRSPAFDADVVLPDSTGKITGAILDMAKHEPGEPAEKSGASDRPESDAIDVDLSQSPSPLHARWFDPVRGRYTRLNAGIENKGVHRFVPPAHGDWVLLLQQK